MHVLVLTMTIQYRKYEKSDHFRLQYLMKELGYGIEKDELEQNIDEIIRRGGQIIIADENQSVIGSVCVIIDVRLAEGIYAEIVSLVVDSTVRGRGVGKGLVKRAEEWAGEHVTNVRVRANEIRNDAHLFYESLGYDFVKKQKVFRKKV